ncbi:hypothetical protein PPL_01933 [Heterostelium album PN500]|uniref:Uncharacterized protein n=1 Tax=Heterostelium pallidum (strain ATCC 26659 / Pp 5 / PN500) TaxID=670386 RepID=D3B0W6_HETP5|nr:hypothetical protein PPL_01933 [Heterostelium album PN500]EFA84940.1 hypothetical protein PPL_01933 [Heterostelium album PN500]|eukprot:XP_020437050.1 hypothetical protein PPL_01933 [Heterostelium album PN500]
MLKQILILILLINILSFTFVQGDCTKFLAKYFLTPNIPRLQMTAIMRNGKVFYNVQVVSHYKWSAFPGYLTNGDPWGVLFADKNLCINGTTQPFTSGMTSFYDAKGILIYPDGRVSISPLWSLDGDKTYYFNLTCSPTSDVYYGESQGNFFFFSFVDLPCVKSAC